MEVISFLPLLVIITLYHFLLFLYALTSKYQPNLSKCIHNSLIFSLISKTRSTNQENILFSITLLGLLGLTHVLFYTSQTTYIIAPLLITHLFSYLHAKRLRPKYCKILLIALVPLHITLYLISLPLILIHIKSHKKDKIVKTSLKELFCSTLSEIKTHLSDTDKSLVESLSLFDSLEARQIMIPKVDMFCLNQNTSIYDAAKECINMGFSRIPVYDKKMDHIHGVLLFKDLLKASLNLSLAEQKQTKIKGYTSPIIFSPETKKIKDLFQEIKKQRIHASIIINEYGCTEGLVTMEDILEELLGSEILDESDIDEEILFVPLKENSWIVNPKMSIIDARKHLAINIKDSSEYETITGYIFSKMRSIPKPGACIEEDCFHINVLSSDQRKISKVKITKTKAKQIYTN